MTDVPRARGDTGPFAGFDRRHRELRDKWDSEPP